MPLAFYSVSSKTREGILGGQTTQYYIMHLAKSRESNQLIILLQFNGVHFAESDNSLSNRISTTLGILEQILYTSRDLNAIVFAGWSLACIRKRTNWVSLFISLLGFVGSFVEHHGNIRRLRDVELGVVQKFWGLTWLAKLWMSYLSDLRGESGFAVFPTEEVPDLPDQTAGNAQALQGWYH